jgi:hypothetical protein
MRGENGRVAVGQNVFIHDPNTARRTLRALGAGEITWIASCRGCWKRNSLRRSLDTAFVTGTVERMLSAARKPAAELGLQISGTAVAVGSINIAPHSDYAAIDRASIKLAEQAGAKLVTSVETTHGVIRAQAEAPFLFVSGIANRVGHFPDENNGGYAQNFAAAHNAAIAVTFLLAKFAAVVGRPPAD